MATTPITRPEPYTARLPLSSHAGALTAAAGAYLAVTHLALLLVVDRSDPQRMVENPVYQGISAAYTAAFPLLIITSFALYELHARRAGTWGIVGICGAVVGTFAMGSDMWFEAFAVPWIVDVAPEILDAEKSGGWTLGYMSAFVLFAAGWVLFGFTGLRTGVLPRGPSIAIMGAGFIGFLAASPPYAVPLGIALLWMGLRLTREKAQRRAE
jgi:hypothetical protein